MVALWEEVKRSVAMLTGKENCKLSEHTHLLPFWAFFVIPGQARRVT
jgi:hypothetical protein